MARAKRKKPYTDIGIARLKCVRCGEQAAFQWQCCSDNNTWRPICLGCDIALNELVLKWMNDPDWKDKMITYKSTKGL